MKPIKIIPCAEDWESFTPTKLGRTCQTCATEVIDFTQMTDKQVKSFFKTMAGTKFCGHFKASQLDPSVLNDSDWLNQSPRTLPSKFMIALVVGFGLSLFSCTETHGLEAIEKITQVNENIYNTTVENTQDHPVPPQSHSIHRPSNTSKPSHLLKDTPNPIAVVASAVTVNTSYSKVDHDRTFSGVPPIQSSRDDVIHKSSIKTRFKHRFAKPFFKIKKTRLSHENQLNVKLRIKQSAFFYIQILTRNHQYIQTVDQVYIDDDHYNLVADISGLQPGKYTLRIIGESQTKDIKFKKK